MGKNKRILKGIESLMEMIVIHFEKIEYAKSVGDTSLVVYYIKEIETKFFATIDKYGNQANIPSSTLQDILHLKQQRNDIKNRISLNDA